MNPTFSRLNELISEGFMTNLSEQPNPQAVEGLLQVDGSDEIDLLELWRALKRRKKLVGMTAAGVIALSSVITAYQRIFRPVYQGSFALLITDPISSDSGNNAGRVGGLNGTMFEDLARNTTSKCSKASRYWAVWLSWMASLTRVP